MCIRDIYLLYMLGFFYTCFIFSFHVRFHSSAKKVEGQRFLGATLETIEKSWNYERLVMVIGRGNYYNTREARALNPHKTYNIS